MIFVSSYLQAGLFGCCRRRPKEAALIPNQESLFIHRPNYPRTPEQEYVLRSLHRIGFSDNQVLLDAFKKGRSNLCNISSNFMKILILYRSRMTADFIVKLYPMRGKDGIPLYIRVSDDFKSIYLSTNFPVSDSYDIELPDNQIKTIFLYVDGEPFVECEKDSALKAYPGIEVVKIFLSKMF